MARQVASFVGALLILVAYVGHQMSWMNARKAGYNLLNASGSATLLLPCLASRTKQSRL